MKRVASIDIFRALTMLLMLWVNDYAGMDGIYYVADIKGKTSWAISD